jgi:CDP-6-deoxy-D-xylo-4-hexulose-3-dehydrase
MYPLLDELRKNNTGYRIAGRLTNTDKVMNQTFWLGVYPGMSDGMIDYIVKIIHKFI